MYRLFFLPLLAVLVSCSTTPASEYFLLSANPVPLEANNGPGIGVGPIDIPEYLNREQLVRRSSSNTLQVAPFQRWSEPLSDGISRVLRLNLSSLLNTENVRRFPWRLDQRPEYTVAVSILGLDSDSNNAQLTAEWRVLRQGKPVAQKLSTLQEDMNDNSGESLAAAYSRLLLRLSNDIADNISRQHNAL